MSRPELHCKFHPHAQLIFTLVRIPKFAQTLEHTERTQIRCSVAGCPFIMALEGDEVRRCNVCGARLTHENLVDYRCNACKRKRKVFLDGL